MARKRSGAIVEKYVHRSSKREAAIRLNKNGMVFWAMFRQILSSGETQ